LVAQVTGTYLYAQRDTFKFPFIESPTG
jgi:hypothetical protein